MGNTNRIRQPEFTAIFDMNGTLVDDARYQRESWRLLCAQKGRLLTDEEFKLHIAGHKQADVIAYLFGSDLPKENAQAYLEEKRRIYREMFGPVMREVPGLTQFLEDLASHNIPLVVATSASQATIDFILDTLNLRRFFQRVVQATQVAKGKPAPDLFLRAAELIGMNAHHCVVFEDSLAGLNSAKAARMRCVGLATTLSIDELIAGGADLAIHDFTEICFEALLGLFGIDS